MTHIVRVLPMFMIAEASTASESWTITLLNYGVAGGMLLWFMWKDKLDRDERKQEKTDQERRHQENLAAQRAVESAFRTNTNSIIIGMSALKHVNTAYEDMLARVKADNGTTY